MKKKFYLLFFFLFALSPATYAGGNVYLSMQGGVGGMDTEKVDVNGSPYTSYNLRDGNAWRPAIGYLFDLGNGAGLGLELGYANYPQNEYTLINGNTETFKGNYVDVLAVGKLHFDSTGHGLYGELKAGTAFITQEFDSPTLIVNTYGTAPEIGLGIGYDFEQPIGVDLTVNHVFANTVSPQDEFNLESKLASITTVMLGVTLRIPTGPVS